MATKKKNKVVAMTVKSKPALPDAGREMRITALMQVLAIAHQIARRQLAEERRYAA